jgi:hypothetical protein
MLGSLKRAISPQLFSVMSQEALDDSWDTSPAGREVAPDAYLGELSHPGELPFCVSVGLYEGSGIGNICTMNF